MVTQRVKVKAAQQRAKAQLRTLRRAVANAVNEADPLGLLAVGAPTDEYEPEVGTIVPRLRGVASAAQVRTVLHEEFVRWFDEELAGPPQRYTTAAKAIWAVLKSEGAV
jgi:hypothetical protein